MEGQYVIPPPDRTAKATRKNRDLEALRLKVTGHSDQEIADTLGLSGDPKKARAAVRRAAAAAYRWGADEQRLMQMQSLEELFNRLWEQLHGEPPPLVSTGRGTVIVDLNGDPVQDSRYKLEVQDRLMRVLDHLAKLAGLYAPTRSEVITMGKLDSEIKALEEELSKRGKKLDVMDDQP